MNISKEELQKLYIDNNLTIDQIAEKLKVSKAAVFRKIKKYEIEKENNHFEKKPLSKELLIDLYINQEKTLDEIAQVAGSHRITIYKWMRIYNIPTRDPNKLREIPSKDKLYDLYVVQCKTLDEMELILNANRNLISKWLRSYNITIRLYNVKVECPTKEILLRLYEQEKMTVKQISELYKTNETVVQRWFYGFSIPLRSNQRKFYHLRGIPLTQRQREFIVGTMLGDGFLACIGKKGSVRLTMTHCEKQLDYLLWKKEIMSNYVNMVQGPYTEKTRNSTRWSWASINLNDFKFFHKLFYENNKKIIREEVGHYLTPLGMAVWFMDDGWKNHSNLRISSEGFTKLENETLSRIIKLNFDINCKVAEYTRHNKKYCYLSFNKENSIKLTKLIKPYVIDLMSYKLIQDCSSTTICQTPTKDDDIV